MEIRVIETSEYKQFAAIEQSAYAGSFEGTKEEREALVDIFKKLTSDDDITAIGAFEAEEMIGSVLYYEFDHNFHGDMIRTAGIGSLAVDLLHKKKHVAQNLIKHCFAKARKSKIELFHLYPFRTDFYRNFGFGHGAPMYTYTAAPKDFIHRGDLTILYKGSKESIDELIEFHNTKALTIHGMSKKTFGDKNRLLRMKKGQILFAKKEGEIIGYLVYYQQGLGSEHNQAQKIVVQEMVYNRDALLAFASFFHVQGDQVNYIEYATHDPDFHYVLNNIQFTEKPKTLEIISLKVAEKSLSLMPLAMDTEKLLKRIERKTKENIRFNIHYPKSAVEKMSIHFSTHPIEIDMSINEFSSWITGCVSLDSLYNRGLLECNMPEKLEKIDHDLNLKAPVNLVRF